MVAKQDFGSEQDETQKEPQRTLYESNLAVNHYHIEPLDISFSGKKREFALEEQSGMSLSKKLTSKLK